MLWWRERSRCGFCVVTCCKIESEWVSWKGKKNGANDDDNDDKIGDINLEQNLIKNVVFHHSLRNFVLSLTHEIIKIKNREVISDITYHRKNNKIKKEFETRKLTEQRGIWNNLIKKIAMKKLFILTFLKIELAGFAH